MEDIQIENALSVLSKWSTIAFIFIIYTQQNVNASYWTYRHKSHAEDITNMLKKTSTTYNVSPCTLSTTSLILSKQDSPTSCSQSAFEHIHMLLTREVSLRPNNSDAVPDMPILELVSYAYRIKNEQSVRTSHK
jgi:hypothetical protein